MTTFPKPTLKPQNPCFSSGPCAKRPGWSYDQLATDILGRSHRHAISLKRIRQVLDLSRAILEIPNDYHIAITPASDTGAVEMALWSMLGAPDIGVDVFAWEAFSALWLYDITQELRLPDVRSFVADYGDLPDLSQMHRDRDAVFAWNGTTSGVCVPHNDSIIQGDKGLRICDATSAVFCYDLPWEKLDVVTWSWQKLMGGEGGHGMIVLSPKAIRRLTDYTPLWPMPKIFRFKNDGKVDMEFFNGALINTPSMICVADAVDSLEWIKSIGGRNAFQQRINANITILDDWVQKTSWVDYLATDKAWRSKTSVCLKIVAPEFLAKSKEDQKKIVDVMTDLLESEQAGYDCKSYKKAPVGLRIWCGGTVESSDIAALTPWLDWAYAQAFINISSAA